MEQIITSNDVENYLGINLASKIGQKDNNMVFVTNWLTERQNEVIDYMASFAWGGVAQVEEYLKDDVKKEAVKRAILAQVSYTLNNAKQYEIGGLLIGAGAVQEVTLEQRLNAGIAPRAHQILASARLLYCGRAL